LVVIWFGGIHAISAFKTADSLIVIAVLILILIIGSVIFTLLPEKSKNWFETDQRIK
jgi:NSS family neurotransmitter:Na+ symporter